MNYLIELARKKRKPSARREHNARMREQFGNDWYKGKEGKSRKYKPEQGAKKTKPTSKPKPKAPPAKPSVMSKAGSFARGRYGYGTIAGLGGLAVGGIIGRMSRKEK